MTRTTLLSIVVVVMHLAVDAFDDWLNVPSSATSLAMTSAKILVAVLSALRRRIGNPASNLGADVTLVFCEGAFRAAIVYRGEPVPEGVLISRWT